MRKTKPKKKREIKYSVSGAVKNIVTPSEEELNSVEIRMHLLNLATVVERHQKVWKNEEEGYLNPYYMILLGKVKNLARKIYDDVFAETDIVGNDPYTKMRMVKAMGICATAFGDPFPLSKDDQLQNLPRGFMGTLGAWARIIKELGKNKWKNLYIKYNMEAAMEKVFDASNRYMTMVFKEITRNELLGGFQL